MAGEIQIHADVTAVTLYAHVWNSTGKIFNATTSAFETYATANIGDYDIAMTEQGTASRFYLGDMPAVVAGIYYVTVQQRLLLAPAENDTLKGTENVYWDGAAAIFSPLSTPSSRLATDSAGRVTIGSILANAVDAAAIKTDAREALANALLDLTNGIEMGFTLRKTMRLIAAVLCGKTSGGAANPIFRSIDDTTDRVATKATGDGNRTSVTLTP